MNETYKSSGVNIPAAEDTVNKIKEFARSTFNKNVLAEIGHFGGLFSFEPGKYKSPVLISSVDGVGTKLKVAIDTGIHNTIGQDLVNHCVNDIAVCGAEPLFFLDYMAFGKLNPDTAAGIVEGFSIACKENGCALIGGETAEMPGLYQESDYDISGTIVGVVEKESIIDGKNIKSGDLLVGFRSNGLHTNGYSLARKVLLKKFDLKTHIDSLNITLSEELLKVHKSYLKLIRLLKENVEVKGLAHITGGGIIGNTMRIVPKGFKIKMHWGNWDIPPIFKLIMESGDISKEEMRKVFNVGIGLVAIIHRSDEELTLQLAHEVKEHPLVIGEIE
ncbi:phosphoribosylformylglycinamidine cyclo-ligase [bacterium BMS3Abin03]|nr:phosphoribosylformylglycinamidine cyclo-ligase [bacterium BMS3Abin03]MCG6961160.1 phosphoribosylformylglycinamidine cyclo-ligase [bacterium BMS3Abin03]